MGGFFLEEDEVCGCKNKWRGSTWGPQVRGRALDPRGQVVAPSGVFSVPDILKYSKKSYFNFRTFGELLFSGYFLFVWIIQEIDKNTIFTLFRLNNRK